MSNQDHIYHSRREQDCRALAERANDPLVRRRHEQLASLHADRAAIYTALAPQAASPDAS